MGFSKLHFGRRKMSSLFKLMHKHLTPLFFVLIMLASIASSFGPWIQEAHAAAAEKISDTSKVKGLDTPQAEVPTADIANSASAQNVPKADGTLQNYAAVREPAKRDHEDTSLRTANSKTFINSDGSKTMEYSVVPKHYPKNGKWEDINPNTVPDDTYQSKTPIADPAINPLASDTQRINVNAADMSVGLLPYEDGLSVKFKDKSFSVKPVGSRNVKPNIEKRGDQQAIVYKNAWPGVNVEYELVGASLKETIVLTKPGLQNVFVFALEGTTASVDATHGGMVLDGVNPEEFFIAPLTVTVEKRGMISENVAKFASKGKTIAITVDADWLASQPKEAYPIGIDPTFENNVGGTYGNFYSYKSDGYSCSSATCDPQAGVINDAGVWKAWRTAFRIPFDQLQGKGLLGATLHLSKKVSSTYTGTSATRWFNQTWAQCLGFNCLNGSSYGPGGQVSTDDWITVTPTLQWMVSNGQWGGWFLLFGEEASYESFKRFEPLSLSMSVLYDNPAPMAQPAAPQDGQVVVSTQPSMQVLPVADIDNDNVLYYYRVSTSPDAESGTVVNSGWMNATQWTVPEGVLQDGTTYYWHTYTWDGYSQTANTAPNWVRSFKVDLRVGKDSTQSYDTAGPVSVDLATGNVTSSTQTHTISAVGGSIGLGLEYNSPVRSVPGLKGEYWQVASGTTSVPTSTPALSRTDSTVDFNFALGNPGAPISQNDWYAARWSGQFIAPTTDTYYFGGVNDDSMKIYINGQQVYNQNCFNGYDGNNCFNTTGVALTKGQTVDIKVEYIEATSLAYIRLATKTANGTIAEQTIPKEWLRTAPRSVAQNTGLVGRYYTDDGTHTFPVNESDPNRFIMSRVDGHVNFNWGSGPIYTNGRSDQFLVRWRGNITVPTSGVYTFGTTADDGVRVKIADNPTAADTTALDAWANHSGTFWPGSGATGTNVSLLANKPYAITIEYYENTATALFIPLVKGPGLDASGQEIPATWLTPRAAVLPDGWSLGMDADGNVNYERLRTTSSSVLLYDSSGGTHEYTQLATGGYKPPVNEDGILVRNADNTFNLTDTDGRIYVFGADGTLTSVTSAVDDRNPIALKYDYAGNPARISKIMDGVDNSRYGKAYYAGDTECGSGSGYNPSVGGFDTQPPAGMLCGFVTTDGARTLFYYKNSQLARVEKPGGEINDFAYDTLGRVVSVRDAFAADVVANAVITGRSNDTSVLTEISYDAIGRASTITLPAATNGSTRTSRSFSYLPGSVQPLYRQYIPGAYRPNGLSTHLLTAQASYPYSSSAWLMIYASRVQLPGTRAIYLCQRPNAQFFAGTDSNCYASGNVMRTKLGYLFTQPTGNATVPLSRLRAADGYVLEYPAVSLAGWTTEEVLGYGYPSEVDGGSTEMHSTPASEPNGYSDKVDYDGLFRTVRDYDLSGQFTTTEWDSVKDLQLSTTDALGMKSTTIYDTVSDRPIDSYGPAQSAWFGADRKPLAANTNQVPHTQTNYDESIRGLDVAVFNNKKLLGVPKLHATAFNNVPYASYGIDLTTGGVTPTDGMSVRASGKIQLNEVGNQSFRAWHSDGMRLYVDNQLVIDDWIDGGERFSSSGIFNNTIAGKWVNIRIEVYKTGTTGRVFAQLLRTPPGGAEQQDISGSLTPAYGLTTSSKVFDSQTGDVSNITSFGTSPTLGQIASATEDSGGQNLTTSFTYEPYQAGSLMRQTSKTLPGGNTFTYGYYGATETRANPCVAGSPAVSQAGNIKGKTEPDPDNTGPLVGRTTETVYDATGRVVATRFNTDPWTCTSFDTRGRVTQTIVPTINTRPGRTITNNYAVGGNPLISSQVDTVAGTTSVTVDLLGRKASTTDTFGYTSTTTYDPFGRVSQFVSQKGTEIPLYDNLNRVTGYTLDGTTYATITYDQYSRIANIDYPQAQNAGSKMKLTEIRRDSLQRATGSTFTFSNNLTFDENITLNQQRGFVTGYTNAYNGQTAGATYTYDKAGRMTAATVDAVVYQYAFGTQDTSCNTFPGYNVNANKNGNRTSKTVNGVTTTYCYNNADQLTKSSDVQIGTPTYDDHGNTTQLAGNGTPINFAYDATDANISITQGTNKVEYLKSATGTVLQKKEYRNNTLDKVYRYAAGVLLTCDTVNQSSCTVTDKYIGLPGGVGLTIKATGNVYTLKNFHGDTAMTIGSNGIPTSSVYLYDPFGQTSPSSTFTTGGYGASPKDPTNSSNQAMAWAANPTRKAEASDLFSIPIIQMGARVYLPTTGRFLQVDPVEGGTPNSYVYVLDPINDSDYSGKFGWAIPSFMTAIAAVAAAVASSVTVTAVVVVAAVAVVAVAAGYGMAKAVQATRTYVNNRSKAQSAPKTAIKTTALPANPPKGCSSYVPAPGYTIVQSKTAAAALSNPTIGAGVGFIQTSLAAGQTPHNRVIVSPGEWKTEPWSKGNWTKYGIGTSGGRDFHYSVNQDMCWYADIKEKRIEGEQ